MDSDLMIPTLAVLVFLPVVYLVLNKAVGLSEHKLVLGSIFISSVLATLIWYWRRDPFVAGLNVIGPIWATVGIVFIIFGAISAILAIALTRIFPLE